jgi:hypothetical protein
MHMLARARVREGGGREGEHSKLPVIWHVWRLGYASCMRNTVIETPYRVETLCLCYSSYLREMP